MNGNWGEGKKTKRTTINDTSDYDYLNIIKEDAQDRYWCRTIVSGKRS